MSETPTFNLWTEPWITAEAAAGGTETVGIEALLLRAGEFRALYDPSPLVIVAILRYLVAILQDIVRPADEWELRALWEADTFAPEPIRAFGKEYAHRFDLFSAEAPFLQSADIPRDPEKRGRGKSVGYLLEELTAGTGVTHYNHLYEKELFLCAACCAKGLLSIPAFASSGGAGIKPSINGVPPIYVIPGGETLYHSLVASLTTPEFQPKVADQAGDTPWWRREPVVGKKQEAARVGYLHSLTFPARRVRLHPEPMRAPCGRCGRTTAWGASEMVYEMGESRPDGAAFWNDPFAAYRLPTGEASGAPTPVRPVEGRAVWREFAVLFLPQATETVAGKLKYQRPTIIDQIEQVVAEIPERAADLIPFQTVGLRTDMKMKIFEWESSGFLMTPRVLNDPQTGIKIAAGLDFAWKCEGILKSMYARYFSGPSPTYPDAAPVKGPAAVRGRMAQQYWRRLGDAFRAWVLRFGPSADLDALFEAWLDEVIAVGNQTFREAAEQLYSGNSTALACEQAISHCHNSLISYRHKQYPQKEPAS